MQVVANGCSNVYGLIFFANYDNLKIRVKCFTSLHKMHYPNIMSAKSFTKCFSGSSMIVEFS